MPILNLESDQQPETQREKPDLAELWENVRGRVVAFQMKARRAVAGERVDPRDHSDENREVS